MDYILMQHRHFQFGECVVESIMSIFISELSEFNRFLHREMIEKLKYKMKIINS